jgi:hypothetical protein
MCCFSKPVISVTATKIFARPDDDNARQFLVYSMALNAEEDLAMALPLPVKIGTDEKGVTFIDLSGYPDFFDEMESGFPPPPTKSISRQSAGPTPPSAASLEVVKVGSFEASFVPTLKDFSRLDERFRISDVAWKKLPDYHDYGFAVFKLKSGHSKIHPMAFSFPRRDERALFFPTVHIHDNEVHAKAEFDHVLYCQPSGHQHLSLGSWRESDRLANAFMKVANSKGVVIAGQHCYRKPLEGLLPNRDTFVSIAV